MHFLYCISIFTAQQKQMEEPVLNPGLANKIYSVRSIRIATLIGGPLAAAYLMATNFKKLGEENNVFKTWLWSIVIFITVLAISFLLTPSIPAIVYNVVYFGIASFFVEKYQAAKIDTHISSGGLAYKTYRAVLIAIACTLILVAIILGCYALSDLSTVF